MSGHAPPASPAAPPPVAVVVSRYNTSVTSRLLEGARGEYARRGGSESSVAVFEAPGTFELPAIAAAAARSGVWRGVVCLGCVVRGETTHDEVIAHAVAHALAELSVTSGLPVGFGVVTAQSIALAAARAGGDKGNRGADAMAAVLDAVGSMAAVRDAAAALRPGAGFTLGRDPHDKAVGI